MQRSSRLATAQLMSYSDYGRYQGVDRSTVSRWVKTGVITTRAGLIDPLVADRELAANRPIPRGRAAYHERNGTHGCHLPTSSRWAPAPAIVALMQAELPRWLVARLQMEGLAPADIAIACAHVIDLAYMVAVAAAPADFDVPPHPPAPPTVDGADSAAVLARISRDAKLEGQVEAEIETADVALSKR